MQTAATRDPDRTRARILDAAFREIHSQGLRAASLEAVVRQAGVTKGALYHHFGSKEGLGCAVLDEVVAARVATLCERLRAQPDVLGALREWLLAPLPEVELGCPLSNLSLELATVDEPLRRRAEAIFCGWRAGVRELLERGQREGQLRADLDAEATATLLLAAFEGAVGLAKSARDEAVYRRAAGALVDLLEGLRPRLGSER